MSPHTPEHHNDHTEAERRPQPMSTTRRRQMTCVGIVAIGLLGAALALPPINGWLTNIPDTTGSPQGEPAGAGLDRAILDELAKGPVSSEGDRVLRTATLGDRDVSTVPGAIGADAGITSTPHSPTSRNADNKADFHSGQFAAASSPNPQPDTVVTTWVDCSPKIVDIAGKCVILGVVEANAGQEDPANSNIPDGFETSTEQLLVPEQLILN